MREIDLDRSEVVRHFAETGHAPNIEGAELLEKESQWRRIIKQAL